jgi:hypothetical protein
MLSITQPHHSISAECIAKLMLEKMTQVEIDTTIWKARSAKETAVTKALNKN